MSDTPQSWYALRDALYAGDFDAAAHLLDMQPALLHHTDGIGETVLHFLAVENALDGVVWLHARGADLDTKNKFGTPALFEVASLEYKDLFDWFLANGADVKALDAEGQDIVQHLLEFDRQDMAEWVRGRGT
ncbi:ankyrin repeat domain-containing protein [Ideonella azotifigens]|uniref:Ankyrin repeat domain-containing protein n=1 Tax=Ideonella azotifigens TaxID=513160 RepID=A0ABN1KGY3_9BURK|nr:ankyrin repeat domain-containing protein [Ideonella azotifigens]MCD2340307.1 ankyrin repeat domain-containing protein [Ideonella azotifigens]